MTITKDIINDLFPLYAENECSADTRALVEDYLKNHPREAEELRRALAAPLPGGTPRAPQLAEAQSFREARRRVRGQAWIMGLAIFFSLAPFSVNNFGGGVHWLFLESPLIALAYAGVGAALWLWFAARRRNASSL